jgi:hypothetical protein
MNEARADRMMDLARVQAGVPGGVAKEQNGQGGPDPRKNQQFREDRRTKATLRTESRCGDPAFLNGALKVVQEECKIAGLHAPKKLEHSGGDKPPQIQRVEVVRPYAKSDPTTDTNPTAPIPPVPPVPERHQVGEVEVEVVRPQAKPQ